MHVRAHTHTCFSLLFSAYLTEACFELEKKSWQAASPYGLITFGILEGGKMKALCEKLN